VALVFYFKNRVRGDVDNCCKAILDGMNEIAYLDDKQVHHLTALVLYDKERPRIEVRVTPYENFADPSQPLDNPAES
jgi:Holliday junction resolvase RusA-like endonuclease